MRSQRSNKLGEGCRAKSLKYQPYLEDLHHEHCSNIGISSITVAELEYGVCKSQQQEKNRSALMQFLIPLEIVEFNQAKFVDYEEHVIDLPKRVCTISVRTMEIIQQMPDTVEHKGG